MRSGNRTFHRPWWLVIPIGVIGLIVGIVLAAVRTPVYTSTATVSAGPISALTASQAASTNVSSLASSYGDVLTSTPVERRIATKLHTTVGYVNSHLSSSAQTGSPMLQITGKGSTAQAAQSLTSAATSALTSYIGTMITQNGSQTGLLNQYRLETRQEQQMKAQIAALRKRTGSAARRQLQDLTSSLAVLQLRSQGLASVFLTSGQANSVGGNATPTVVSSAGGASSDRSKKMLEFAIVGLLIGLCLGASVALVPSTAKPLRAPVRRSNDAVGEV